MVDVTILREQLFLGRRLWVKVLGMLQHNWAVYVSRSELEQHDASLAWLIDAELRSTLVESGQAGHALFFDDHGALFDLLAFDSMSTASEALRFNGFDAVAERPSFLHASGWPRLPIRKGQSRSVYSSGEYWHELPPGFIRREMPRSVPAEGEPNNIERFVVAQDPVWFDVLEELIEGQKVTHWMWFIFPQLRGLGRSHNAQYFGLASLDEAQAYAEHFVLGPRLETCIGLVLMHRNHSPKDILGPVDAMKLRSCATLFAHVPRTRDGCQAILAVFFKNETCEQTNRLLQLGLAGGDTNPRPEM